MERIITVDRQGDQIIYSGSAERNFAHQKGICHLTVIIIPFIADGKNKGKWVVHNRRDKQLAKGLACPAVSFNLFGGHCNPPKEEASLVDKEVRAELLLDSALRELSEELFLKADEGMALECFGSKDVIIAKRYPVNSTDLIPLGYTYCKDKNDIECSYVYAFSVPSAVEERIIAADDYTKSDGSKGNVALPVFLKSESELIKHHNLSESEICNAITRLWKPQNAEIHSKLLQIMHG